MILLICKNLGVFLKVKKCYGLTTMEVGLIQICLNHQFFTLEQGVQNKITVAVVLC
jgi:hypothetical protein